MASFENPGDGPGTNGIGPYMLQPLVDDLPLSNQDNKSVKITCVEAWEGNIYVGTSSHELLHFVILPSPSPSGSPGRTFKSEKLTIIPASRQPVPSSPATGSSSGAEPYIQQILLLPEQMKVLVLSSTGLVIFYALPELSRVFEGVKVSNITFMVLDSEKVDPSSQGGEGPQPRGTQVMLCGKKNVRVITVGTDARLYRKCDIPDTIHAARQGVIACVATETDYALIHIDSNAKISLPPIVSSQETTSESPSLPVPTLEPLPELPPKTNPAKGANTRSSPPISGSSTPTKHPPRLSSLPRPRSGDFSGRLSNAASGKPNPHKHTRATSTGSMQPPTREPQASGRLSPQIRSSSPRSASPRRLAPPSNGSSLLPVPGSPSPSGRAPSPLSLELPPSIPPSTTTKSPPPSPSVTPPRQKSPIQKSQSAASDRPTADRAPKREKVVLKPHIVTPAPDEFLITTGTGNEEPGVGVFFNTNGDPTPRGIINFKRYPEKLLLDKDGWLIALLGDRDQDGVTIEVFHFDQEAEERGKITLPEGFATGTVGIQNVHAGMRFIVEDIGTRLMFVRLRLDGNAGVYSPPDWEVSRNEEEIQAARRLSQVESNILVWDETQIWSLIQRPALAILDESFPNITASGDLDGLQIIDKTFAVLRRLTGIHPQADSYIKQKAGLLLLSALITSDVVLDMARTKTIENILLESGIDARIVVALFPAFRREVVEGDYGLWAYAGVKVFYDEFYSRASSIDASRVGNNVESKIVLKNYLTSWRHKKGFGSVVDEKEVFRTVDATLLVVLLDLASVPADTRSPDIEQVIGVARNEIYALIDGGLDCFERAVEILEERNRLYVLSYLYQTRRMYSDVLATWRRILESQDGDEDFTDGEDRMKEYLIGRKDKDVVLQYSIWLAKRNPRKGIDVFVDPRCKVKWDPAEVLRVLKAEVPAAYRIYLEYMVLNEKATQFSNELIFIYLDEVINAIRTNSETAEVLQSSYEAYRALDLPKPTYRTFIADNSSGDEWWLNRIRLLELLGEESGYDSSAVLERIKPYEKAFVAEMIILCGRESRHAGALHLLCHGLKDFDTAINYCLFGGMSIFQAKPAIPPKEEQTALLSILLVELLQLEDFDERLKQTSSLLSRFGGWLDVHQVLNVIPDSWSVEHLSGFLTKALRQLVREKNEALIGRALSRSLSTKIAYEFVELCQAVGPRVQTTEFLAEGSSEVEVQS